MDLGIVAAVVLLIVWGVGTVLEMPGWVHGLLTAGTFLLIYRVVVRGTPDAPKGSAKGGASR